MRVLAAVDTLGPGGSERFVFHAVTATVKRSAVQEAPTPRTDGLLDLYMIVESPKARTGRVFVGVPEGPAAPVLVLRRDVYLAAGETEVRCSVAPLPVPRSRFYEWAGIYDSPGHELVPWNSAAQFYLVGPELDEAPRAIARLAPVHFDTVWSVEA